MERNWMSTQFEIDFIFRRFEVPRNSLKYKRFFLFLRIILPLTNRALTQQLNGLQYTGKNLILLFNSTWNMVVFLLFFSTSSSPSLSSLLSPRNLFNLESSKQRKKKTWRRTKLNGRSNKMKTRLFFFQCSRFESWFIRSCLLTQFQWIIHSLYTFNSI